VPAFVRIVALRSLFLYGQERIEDRHLKDQRAVVSPRLGAEERRCSQRVFLEWQPILAARLEQREYPRPYFG